MSDHTPQARNFREEFSSSLLDSVLCHFMRTALYLGHNGLLDLPLPYKGPEPVASLVELAGDLIADAQPPEVTQLLLDAQYQELLAQGGLSLEELLALGTVRQLAMHLPYDPSPYEYLLSLENLFGDKAQEYYTFTFAPNLPPQVREHYGMDDFLQFIPKDKLRLDYTQP